MVREPRFGFLGTGAFLNHAGVSPPCRAARRAVMAASNGLAREAPDVVRSRDTSARARRAFASFVEARMGLVQCFQNTSAALSAVAFGLPWRRGDGVVVSANEFVSNYLVWKAQAARGVRVRHVPTTAERIDPDALAKTLDGRTRVVALSAVHWATGARQDLRALSKVCRDVGAFLVVDAAQSLGAVVHSRRRDGYDLLATNTYKWLVSFNGTGFADFSPELAAELNPAALGWLSVAGEPEPDRLTPQGPKYRLGIGVERLLGGAPSALSNLAAKAALDDLAAYGRQRIADEVVRVARRVMEVADALGVPVVTPRGRNEHAGIVALEVARPEAVSKALRRHGVRTSARGGFLRVSPHFYTSSRDLDALAQGLGRVLGRFGARAKPS